VALISVLTCTKIFVWFENLNKMFTDEFAFFMQCFDHPFGYWLQSEKGFQFINLFTPSHLPNSLKNWLIYLSLWNGQMMSNWLTFEWMQSSSRWIRGQNFVRKWNRNSNVEMLLILPF
jgi:hypothetical protein